MIEALENNEEEVRVGGELIPDIRFADAQGMVGSSELGLQRLMDRLNAIAKHYNMKLNVKKDQNYGNLKKRWRNSQYHGRRTKSGASQKV